MKSRSTQSDTRENTASSRRHAPRLVLNTVSDEGSGKRSPKRRCEQQDPLSASETTMESLVDIHDAAQFLAVSVSTLYGWVWQRRISFVKVGRAVRFDLSDLQRFVEENRIHARVPRKL
jgi:excisionase family DNA binding protein